MAYGLLLALSVLSACIVPIPAEPVEDADAGTNAYPVIKTATPAMPGPLLINKSSPPQSVSLTLADTDLRDILYVKVFIDYPVNKASVKSTVRNDEQGGGEERSLAFDTRGWCDAQTQGSNHVVDVVVADRDFDDNRFNTDFRTPFPPGKTSTRSWLIQCTAP